MIMRAAATGAWRAMVGGGAGCRVRLVVLRRWIGHRRGRDDQFSGARDVGLAASAGEQPVVADAVEALGQDVEQEAPDELIGSERHRAIPRLSVWHREVSPYPDLCPYAGTANWLGCVESTLSMPVENIGDPKVTPTSVAESWTKPASVS
jgi:hypothetical protein